METAGDPEALSIESWSAQDPVEVADLEHPANAPRRAHQRQLAAALAQPLQRADHRAQAERVDKVQLRDVEDQQAAAISHRGDDGLAEVGSTYHIEIATDAEHGPTEAVRSAESSRTQDTDGTA